MKSPVFPPAIDHVPSDDLFGTTFTQHWDQYTHNMNQEPAVSFSHVSTPKTNSSSSGSDDRCPVVIDERKRKRMISNRESARRSRMRKQKHLENLRNLVNRHKSGNQELMNRVRFAFHHGQILGQENERLRSESVMLRQKLWDLHQVMLVWQLPKELL
ncbi:hypothetical protein QVD17_36870 [Tagetes erecta]|uniref:BZIP domain-containing protein n=1 Tax=Tagetes erecta TaxID=13708 RepID=A0AAD8JZH4_TARER|nr:hypothetical protein QVD17_36870 [Tagetes erecta]